MSTERFNIEIKIWTHIGHPFVKVDASTLAQMQTDAKAEVIGRYTVLWCTDEEKILVINWSNVIMLESPAPKSTASSESY